MAAHVVLLVISALVGLGLGDEGGDGKGHWEGWLNERWLVGRWRGMGLTSCSRHSWWDVVDLVVTLVLLCVLRADREQFGSSEVYVSYVRRLKLCE